MMPSFEIGRDALVDRKHLSNLKDPELTGGQPSFGESKASIRTYTDNSVTVSVDTPTNGVLVLHDLFYPGWTATVDGRPTPLLRANLIFRGVEVPAGHHLVAFSFQPLSIRNLVAAAEGLRQGNDE